MKEPKWLIGVALGAATVALYLHWNWDGRLGTEAWSAVSAMATTVAVVVALGVPIWQDRVRRVDLRREKIQKEWIAADDLLELNREAFRYMKDFLSDRKRPTAQREAELVAGCEGSKKYLVSLSARHLFDKHAELILAVGRIDEEAEGVPAGEMRKNYLARLSARWVVEAGTARKQSRAWAQIVLNEAKAHGVEVPPLDLESSDPFSDATKA